MDMDTVIAYCQFFAKYQKVKEEWEATTPAPTRTPQPTNTPFISSHQPVNDYQPSTVDLAPTPFRLGLALTDFIDRFVNEKAQEEWEAATPAPTRTPQLTNTPFISSHQPVDDYQPTTIDLTPTPCKLGFSLTDFHDRFVNNTNGFALCGEIAKNGKSGMYWRFGLSPDGNSEFAFGDVGFRSVNQTSEEGYSIWLAICHDDSSESFRKWVASIRSPEDLYSTNQYDAFKEIACCFIKTLDPQTSDEEAYQIIFDAIQKGAEEDYQYHCPFAGFSGNPVPVRLPHR